jgi:hypothetical protein
MKLCHVRWVPHTLSREQKAKRTELAKTMLAVLAKHGASSFEYLFTGDESWIFYTYHQQTRWVALWEEVDEVPRMSQGQKKIMLTAFFNGRGRFVLDILPAGTKMNSTYFTHQILAEVVRVSHQGGTSAGADP